MSTDIKLHKDDLPANLNFGPVVACDCEFTGLNPPKDKLCLIQLCSEGSKEVHIVQFVNRESYKAPNLIKLLIDPNVKKIFHYARKDLQMIRWALKIDVANIECTKLQSKLARGYSGQHSYKILVQEFCGISISKAKQSSDFGKKDLDTFDRVNKELIGDLNNANSGIIDQTVIVYKISASNTETNMYG